ncbi:DUF202 domain-containing protein [Streptacidiphilus sp. PB12-B1b]|nr:DUF202 domain-containing protein [Streptacidiphilus sp. PB12-B1b]
MGSNDATGYLTHFGNERTFLAWIRTSLALLAGALAVAQFPRVAPPGLRAAVVYYLIALAVGAAGAGYWFWRLRQKGARSAGSRMPVQAILALALLALVGPVVIVIAVRLL